jgi:hypothetical protein
MATKEYGLQMNPDIENIRLKAQDTLDELFTEHLIPFKLSARELESLGSGEYIIRFYDNRLSSMDISWAQGQSFKDVFRASVLDRIKRLGRPMHQFSPGGVRV